MGELNFCASCGRLEKYCICDIEVEYLEDSNTVFRVEYAFESLTDPQFSIFKTILPDYD